MGHNGIAALTYIEASAMRCARRHTAEKACVRCMQRAQSARTSTLASLRQGGRRPKRNRVRPSVDLRSTWANLPACAGICRCYDESRQRAAQPARIVRPQSACGMRPTCPRSTRREQIGWELVHTR